MMEDENQNTITPLLGDEEHDVTIPVAEEAIPLPDETTPQSKMSSGLSQRQKPQNISVPKSPSSSGRFGHEEEESETSQSRRELGPADMCLVLVYAQWIWPSMVNAGLISEDNAVYNRSGMQRWSASMIGNALFFACLWWIKTGTSTTTVAEEETSFGEDEKKKKARGAPRQQQQQHIVRTDILPTVVWGILPPLCNFISECPEAMVVLALAVFLPFSIILVQHSRRNGLESTMASCCNCCSRCLTQAAAPFERAIPFKRVFKQLEEDYFEELRARENEDAKELEEQQERLSHLEDNFRSLSKDDAERVQRKQGCIICVLLVLAVAEVIYASFSLIRLEHTWPEQRVSHRVAVGDRVAVRDSAMPILQKLNLHNWDEVTKRNPATFINFCAPWAIHCERLAPVWAEFAKASKGMPLTVATVDCVEEYDLCRKEKAQFPTLRWYQDSGWTSVDYTMETDHEFVQDFLNFSERKIFGMGHAYLSTGNGVHKAFTNIATSFDPLQILPPPQQRLSIAQSALPGLSRGQDSGAHQGVATVRGSVKPTLQKIDEDNWDTVLHSNPATFINFCASWANHCRHLVPAWTELAEASKGMPLTVATVDCVEQSGLCNQEIVMAYPTLRWYEHGQLKLSLDLKLEWTVKDFLAYSKMKLGTDSVSSLPVQMSDVASDSYNDSIGTLGSARGSTGSQIGDVLSDYQSGDEKLVSFGDETGKNVPVSQIIVDHPLEPSSDEVINPSGSLAMKR